MEEIKNKLWTKDFTIITFGSLISMLGTSVAFFAFGLKVFDTTGSTFLYSLMMIANVLPQIVIPIFAGAFLDRRSRRITIYTLDFIFTGIYGAIALIEKLNFFNYWVYLVIVVIVGSLNSFYMVAYDSYFPNLITGKNYSKAYAIGSLMYPIASTIMVPIAGWAYERVGTFPLFLFASITSFFTAVVETRVRAKEPHLEISRDELEIQPKISPFKQFGRDLKAGLSYLRQEKGLMTITVYFFFTSSAGAVLMTLFLPYLRSNMDNVNLAIGSKQFILNSTMIYSIIMGVSTFGRIIGGTLHYVKKLPVNFKFTIALMVYILIGIFDSIILFMPYWWIMALFQFAEGILGVTSFNIRISGTQNYVPDTVRARFNGTFALITTSGSMIGQLIAGILGEYFDARYIVFFAMMVNFLAIFFVMFARRKHVKPIYNCDI